jgi:hypothetical protein
MKTQVIFALGPVARSRLLLDFFRNRFYTED